MNLMALLQGIGAAPAEEGITVTSPRIPQREIQDDTRPAPQKKYMEELIPRKGMFGVKGTLRDIIGTLGDAFLVQSGNKAVYAPQREKEKLASALYDFTENPTEALERVAAIDPNAALELYQAVAIKQLRQDALDRQLAGDADKRYQQYAGLWNQYMGGATPETWGKIAPILRTLKKRGNLGDEFLVPDEYDEAFAQAAQRAGMKTNQQVSTSIQKEKAESLDEYRGQRLRQIDEAEEGRNDRFAKAEAGKNRRDDVSRTTLAAALIAKVRRGEKLTPGEQKALDRLLPENKKSRRAPPSLPPGFKMKPVKN